MVCALSVFSRFTVYLSTCSPGSSGSSALNGSGHCQNHSVSLTQAPLPTHVAPHNHRGKGTFTDDLHQLVDNWARDAINLSQCKRGPKTGAQAALGHDVGIQYIVSSSMFTCTLIFCFLPEDYFAQLSHFHGNKMKIKFPILFPNIELSRIRECTFWCHLRCK